jgi:hypothetical protein
VTARSTQIERAPRVTCKTYHLTGLGQRLVTRSEVNEIVTVESIERHAHTYVKIARMGLSTTSA